MCDLNFFEEKNIENSPVNQAISCLKPDVFDKKFLVQMTKSTLPNEWNSSGGEYRRCSLSEKIKMVVLEVFEVLATKISPEDRENFDGFLRDKFSKIEKYYCSHKNNFISRKQNNDNEIILHFEYVFHAPLGNTSEIDLELECREKQPIIKAIVDEIIALANFHNYIIKDDNFRNDMFKLAKLRTHNEILTFNFNWVDYKIYRTITLIKNE